MLTVNARKVGEVGMITKCFFDDDKFVTQNANTVIVSSDTEIFGYVHVIINYREGKMENDFIIKGEELIRAVQNCLHTKGSWGEF